MTHDETPAALDGPTVPRAVTEFEASFRKLYARPERALARFWEAVDTLGFKPANTQLWDAPSSFGAVKRRWPNHDRSDLVSNAHHQAEEAYLFRGLRPPPARMRGPLDALKEREARARRPVRRVLNRLYRDPESAFATLAAVARTSGPKAATAALADHQLGATREANPVLWQSELRAVRRWARNHAIVADPAAHVEKERQRFRAILSHHLLGEDAEADWRETVRSSGTFQAAYNLTTRAYEIRNTTSPLPVDTPGYPQAKRLELRTRALAHAEAVAHSAGFRSELHVGRPQAVTTVAIAWSDSNRRSEAAELADATYESISYLRGAADSWERARKTVETARAECVEHLVPVVRDPAWVVDRVVAAPPDEQARMLSALRSTPALAQREIGARAALVEHRGWWPFRRTPPTAVAQREAPMAAAWLAHLAVSTRAEDSARRALAADLGGHANDSPERLRTRLADTLSELTTRGADYDALVRSLADAAPAHTVLRGIGQWPPHLKHEVEQVAGARLVSFQGERPTATREPAVGSLSR